MLSITTDYVKDTGNPSPYLRGIADAGFSHIHWCHHWNTDFLYSRWEMRQVRKWLSEYGLKLLDLHGSVGPEKNWASAQEHERRAGVELVVNRVEMTAYLGGKSVVMHIPKVPGSDPLRRSLDEIAGFARGRGVRIAVENGSFPSIRQVLSEYGPDYVGVCYDSGHGNLDLDGPGQLDALKGRLIALHLHDNDGTGDQHNLLFSGTVDWPRLASIIATSSYRKCVSMESNIHKSGIKREKTFLSRAFKAGTRFAGMIADERKKGRAPG